CSIVGTTWGIDSW
nr:immunoglobulin heavy chain junction region [Macaca mulatta]MOV47052.1 immunoglobulin heavy chain junction region [Macaca mulatta]